MSQALLLEQLINLNYNILIEVSMHMDITKSWQYCAIAQYYKDKNAKRSGLPYIKHIDEGIEILRRIDAPALAIYGFILHPLFQGDEALAKFWDQMRDFNTRNIADMISTRELAVVLEYRNLANGFLSRDVGIRRATLSPMREVNLMLLADKVQNQADFYRYQSCTGPKATLSEHKYHLLERYFIEWRTLLKQNFPEEMKHFPLEMMLEVDQLRIPVETYQTMKITEGAIYDFSVEQTQ